MNYKQKFKIGDIVKGVRTFNGEVIEGKFNGFHLFNKLNPISVVGIIETGNRCYDVCPDSIKLAESDDERIKKEIIELVRNHARLSISGKMVDWLEKQGEQKPIDKVEPKFKIGDFVVRELDNTCYQIKNCILNVTNNKYGYDLTNGGYISSQDANFYHLWTIQDAKDGDVLYSLDSNQPFIYKSRKAYEQAIAYCGINKLGKFFVWNTKDGIITLDKYIPATKEQCDLLFQKMKEAGYEWDAEKKELRKIETSTWSEEDERILYNVITYVGFAAGQKGVRDDAFNKLGARF